MQSFRSHLELFRTGGKHCSQCCDKVDAEHKDAVEIDGMMKSKFHMTWRHSIYAWVCFMGLLLLAFIYAENTNWTDSWYRVPTKYNITDLMNADDDQIAAFQPKPKGKAAKNAAEKDEEEANNVKVTEKNQVTEKNAKTAKKNVDEVQHSL